jgi:hypothetical protein
LGRNPPTVKVMSNQPPQHSDQLARANTTQRVLNFFLETGKTSNLLIGSGGVFKYNEHIENTSDLKHFGGTLDEWFAKLKQENNIDLFSGDLVWAFVHILQEYKDAAQSS